MDHSQGTEFASERYFSKLDALHHQPGSGNIGGIHPHPSHTIQNDAQFSLPIRASNEHHARPNELKRKGLFKFKSLRHAKLQTPPSLGAQHVPQTAASIEPAKPKKQHLDHIFSGLPNELQLQVIALLPLSDVLNLRSASRSWHALISLNEAPIVRYHLEHHIPAYAKRLYPSPPPSALNFHYLCGLWHRLHVAAKLAYLISDWVTKELFLRTTEAQRLEFAPQRERMRRRLIPLVFTIFHFFENYRELHVKWLHDNGGRGLHQTPYTLNPIEVDIMSKYDDKTLLSVHQVFPLVVSAFLRRLRPPSYVGRVERSIRGYLREKPADEVHVAAMCVGGLRQVEKIWEVKGYNSRRSAIDVWYNSITKDATDMPSSTPPSKRRGLINMNLGRKKSTTGRDDAHNTLQHSNKIAQSSERAGRGSMDSMASTGSNRHMSSLVFNTSLSNGMPMGSLQHEDLHRIVPDLPVLQKLWLHTAEALILERRIVARAADIKRNSQVMLDLIKEDNLCEEDEWWYGRGAPESVRPPKEATDEDTLE